MMRKSALGPPSPAMVVAVIALFVALGGTGYAASQLTRSPAAGVAKKKKHADAAQDLAQTRSFFNANKSRLTGPQGPAGRTGPQGSQGPQGPAGPPGSAGTPATTARTELSSPGQTDDLAPTGTYALLATVGTFTKQQAGTVVKITWNGHARMAGTAGTAFCDFQVRVDGAAPDSNAGRAVLYTNDAPVGVTAVFSALVVGMHTVAVYDRGISATRCTINPVTFPDQFLVEEQA